MSDVALRAIDKRAPLVLGRLLWWGLGGAGLLVALVLLSFSVAYEHFDQALRLQEAEPNVERWRAELPWIEACAPLTRWNADWQDAAGRWYQIGATFEETPAGQVGTMRKALSHFDAAATMRPQISQIELNRARINYFLNPGETLWQQQLERAVSLNLRGQFTQMELLLFVNVAVEKLTPELRLRVRQSLDQGFRDNPGELAKLANQIGRLNWLCDPAAPSQLNAAQQLECQALMR